MPESNNAALNRRLEEWKQRLIDLTRRNRLLYFQPSKGSTLTINTPDIFTIFARLYDQEKAWHFYMPPLPPNTIESADGEILEDNAETNSPAIDERIEIEVRSNEIFCRGLSRKQLEGKLKSLFRKARTDYQERGVRVLYLAFGTLIWRDRQGSLGDNTSPLVLCPVDLRRESAAKPFELFWAEEDLVLNPALSTKLKQDFQLELPLVSDDFNAESLSKYFSHVGQIVRNLGWTVQPTIHLGLFSFHKLAIYQDLKENARSIQDNLIVRGLVGESFDNKGIESIPDASDLDSIQQPQDTFQILDADSSQQQTIQAALRGHNLVLHGPPGTGKSQTIANIVAEFLARGKRVLFVSEKMAALEVVYKRLRDSNLHEYCLELHSHKANKREVVAALKESLDFKVVPRNLPQSLDYEKLSQTRARLNDYVKAIHRVRQPLGASVRDVLSRMSKFKSIKYIPLQLATPEASLDATYLIERENLVKQLANLWHVVEAGENFAWYGCLETSFEMNTSVFFERRLSNARKSLEALRQYGTDLARDVGLEIPQNLAEFRWMLTVGKHLCQSPAPDASWLTTGELDAISREAEMYRQISGEYWREHSLLLETYNAEILNLASPTSTQLQNLRQMVIGNGVGLSGDDGQSLIEKRDKTVDFLDRSIRFVLELIEDVEILRRSLELPQKYLTVRRADEIAQLTTVLADLSESIDKPELTWFETGQLDELQTVTNRMKPIYNAFNEKRKIYESRRVELLKKYDAAIFQLNINELIENFAGFLYRSPFRFLSPQFYRDKRTVLSVSRSAKLDPNVTEDLLEAREIIRLGEEIKAETPSQVKIWGRYDEGADTDFERIGRAITVTREVLRLTSNAPSKAILQLVSQPPPTVIDLRRIAERVVQTSSEWRALLDSLSDVIPSNYFSQTKLPFLDSDLEVVLKWAKDNIGPLQELRDLLNAQLSYRKSNSPVGFSDLIKETELRQRLQQQQARTFHESERLRRKFGKRYAGLQTTWTEIISAIEWTNQMRKLFGNRAMSAAFVERCTLGGAKAPQIHKAVSLYNEFHSMVGSILEKFDPAYPRKNGKRLDVCSFDEMEEIFRQMLDQIDELQNWVDYKLLKVKLDSANLNAFVSELQKLNVPKTDFVSALQKSLYLSWLGDIFQKNEVLRSFRANSHESLISEFQEVDRKLVRLGAQTIIEQCEKQRPTNTFTMGGNSEISILQREAAKKRRHLPVRDLFQTIPNLLLKLKPCLMMSPLSVSQFLPPPEKLKFDLVIFDEASQIFTEDAVGAIYRGAQLIVAGDNKQMPPTDFFRATENDEGETETGENVTEQAASSADFASVLDEVQIINGVSVQNLRWHYRSRHESLIAFSNNRFYGDKLVTFPSAHDKNPMLGIEFIHVADGVYDRGGRRDNKREAEIVTERVFEHFLKFPDKSLGVVAFSQAQMTAIEDEIERRTRTDRRFDEFFKEDRLEGFFVKNLENVQGDERDVIFFSVGYGRDSHGNLTMAFGPLNKDGGERRLNVAITRAREKVVLISSIKARDLSISPTSGAGVLNFQRYLDYAERGTVALALNAPEGVGEADSPLEEDIAAEIKSLGYDLVTQVGCSGYRIDIGVLDPLLPGRFLLGIEADGATYHSAYTTRDRDRLRQQILENLGWKIHRIWSPDWIAKRQTEIERLRKALVMARSNFPGNSNNALTLNTIGDTTQIGNQLTLPLDENEDSEATNNHIQREQREIISLNKPPESITYQPCHINYGEGGPDVSFYRPDSLTRRINILERIVLAESPIHVELAAKRLARAWCMERIAKRILTIVEETIIVGERYDKWVVHGEFIWLKESIEQAKVLLTFPVRVPDEYDLDTRRDVKFICSEEVQAAMMLVLKHAMSLETDFLMNETRRLFGFSRSGDNIKDRLRSELKILEEKNLVNISEGKISLKI